MTERRLKLDDHEWELIDSFPAGDMLTFGLAPGRLQTMFIFRKVSEAGTTVGVALPTDQGLDTLSDETLGRMIREEL